MDRKNREEYLDQLRKMALQAADQGREPFAVEILPAYLEHRANDGYAWAVYGNALRVLGRFSEALPALLKAKSLAPVDKIGWLCGWLGMLHSDNGEHEEAERWYARATESDLGNEGTWVWILRGANLAHLGQFDAAAECHRRATELEGDVDEAYLNLGLVLRAQGKYAEAAEAFRSALSLTKDYPAAKKALDSLADVSRAVELAKSMPVE